MPDQCSLYDHPIYGRKRKIQRTLEDVVLTLGLPRIIHLTAPKTMAKNDKYVADMAIESRRSFKLLSVCPGLRFFFVFLFCMVVLLQDMVELSTVQR